MKGDRFEWYGDCYDRVRADGAALYVAGWVGPLGPLGFFKTDHAMNWYARTAGNAGVPPARAEFETKEEAMAFVQMMCNMEAT